MHSNLFTDVRHAGVTCIAKQFGLTVLDFPIPGSITPCPGCQAEQRGTGDRRGPIGVTREGLGFLCHRCKASGDALSLAALILTGNTKPTKEGWQLIRQKFLGAELPQYIAPTREYRRPPLEEIEEIWEKSTPVYDSDELVPLLEYRCLDPGILTQRDLCRRIKRGSLPTWAGFAGNQWNQTGHLCVFPLYDHFGQMVSLHARRIAEGAERPKGLSPLGFEVGGLLFMDLLGRALFRGDAISWLLVAEGAPDFLTASLICEEQKLGAGVVGVLSGSWLSCVGKAVPVSTKVTIATHEDPTGERFAQKIARSLTPQHQIVRWRYQP